MLGSNILLFLFIFKRDKYLQLWNGFFKGKELLVIFLYDVTLFLPAFAYFIKRSYKAYMFMEEGYSGLIYVFSRVSFPLLCITILPYLILTRKYKNSTQWGGLALCFFSLLVGLLSLIAGSNMELYN